MKLTQSDLRIGDWWAPCCVHDLQEILTPSDLEEAQTMMPFSGGWHTLPEAMSELLKTSHYFSERDLAEDIEYAKQRFPAAFGDSSPRNVHPV